MKKFPKIIIYISLAWIILGILLNFVKIGGSWVRTTEAISMSKGNFKDYYPITEIHYAGLNFNNEVIICISGRQLLETKPNKIQNFDRFKPVRYGVKLTQKELTTPAKSFLKVSLSEKKNNIDTFVYTYSKKNIISTCPLEKNLSLFILGTINNDVARGLRILIYKYSTHLSHPYHSYTLKQYNEKLNKLFPLAKEKILYSSTSQLIAHINVNEEYIKITGVNGAIHNIYLPTNISKSGNPIILTGGYISYEAEINIIHIVFSLFLDIILQPIKYLYHLIVITGFMLLGPA